jgi:hypothetical protein
LRAAVRMRMELTKMSGNLAGRWPGNWQKLKGQRGRRSIKLNFKINLKLIKNSHVLLMKNSNYCAKKIFQISKKKDLIVFLYGIIN